MMKKNLSSLGEKQGSFLNGKGQVIELLKFLTHEEKERILNRLRILNPQLASELNKSSVKFDDLFKKDPSLLKKIFSSFPPAITGMALKNCPSSFQRHILEILDRDYSRAAFQILQGSIQNEQEISKKAKDKILSYFQQLSAPPLQ
jgi:flagellar motor switch protein FliG